MDWTRFLNTLQPPVSRRDGASRDALSDAERALGVHLPTALHDLLGVADGVEGEYGLALIWPLRRIVDDNLAFRQDPVFATLYMPFDSLLFFADAGNGDQFAFPLQGGSANRNDVFVWNHEDDSRTWIAPTLDRYLEWWVSGRTKV